MKAINGWLVAKFMANSIEPLLAEKSGLYRNGTARPRDDRSQRRVDQGGTRIGGRREGGNEEMDGRERERIYKRISRENEGKSKGKRGEN